MVHGGRVIVLQHPHEARRAMRTEPILRLALANVTTLRGRRFQRSALVTALAADPRTLLLYPAPSN